MPVHPTRRDALSALAAATAGLSLLPTARAAPQGRITKPIPSSGEAIPVIGMGTWQTFNVGDDPGLRAMCARVMQTFLALGGGMVDSSPMYGSAQAVIGHSLGALPEKALAGRVFSADKIWSSDGGETHAQFGETARAWGLARFDLMQVHNLRAWQPHLATMLKLKAAGKIRYVGISTSHGRRHDELAQIMANEPIDFVQLTYDIGHRGVEQRLLPLARDRGIAVIANRPFDGGDAVRRLKRSGAAVPPWAVEAGMRDWPSFLLKWIVSHPAVTVAIPATSRVDHMRENMAAGFGALPDAKLRARMVAHMAAL